MTGILGKQVIMTVTSGKEIETYVAAFHPEKGFTLKAMDDNREVFCMKQSKGENNNE